jgi:hypothetical protein
MSTPKGGNEQQRRISALAEKAANAKTPQEHDRISQQMVNVITEKPKRRG